MRFVCDSCRAQYMISDDKVGANGVKVRCKKCGNVIVVRRPQDSSAEAEMALAGLEESAPQPPAPEAPTGENSIFSDVDDEEIGAAFESALGERQDDEPVAPPQEEPPPEANLPPVSDGPPRRPRSRMHLPERIPSSATWTTRRSARPSRARSVSARMTSRSPRPRRSLRRRPTCRR